MVCVQKRYGVLVGVVYIRHMRMYMAVDYCMYMAVDYHVYGLLAGPSAK